MHWSDSAALLPRNIDSRITYFGADSRANLLQLQASPYLHCSREQPHPGSGLPTTSLPRLSNSLRRELLLEGGKFHSEGENFPPPHPLETLASGKRHSLRLILKMMMQALLLGRGASPFCIIFQASLLHKMQHARSANKHLVVTPSHWAERG